MIYTASQTSSQPIDPWGTEINIALTNSGLLDQYNNLVFGTGVFPAPTAFCGNFIYFYNNSYQYGYRFNIASEEIYRFNNLFYGTDLQYESNSIDPITHKLYGFYRTTIDEVSYITLAEYYVMDEAYTYNTIQCLRANVYPDGSYSVIDVIAIYNSYYVNLTTNETSSTFNSSNSSNWAFNNWSYYDEELHFIDIKTTYVDGLGLDFIEGYESHPTATATKEEVNRNVIGDVIIYKNKAYCRYSDMQYIYRSSTGWVGVHDSFQTYLASTSFPFTLSPSNNGLKADLITNIVNTFNITSINSGAYYYSSINENGIVELFEPYTSDKTNSIERNGINFSNICDSGIFSASSWNEYSGSDSGRSVSVIRSRRTKVYSFSSFSGTCKSASSISGITGYFKGINPDGYILLTQFSDEAFPGTFYVINKSKL